MDNSAIVKYYDPRTGKYEFATVLDVGDLSKLNTTIKTDLVSAINSLQDSDWGKLPPETIEDLENIKGAIGSIKDGTFVIEEWGSFDQYFKIGIEDAIEQLNIFNRDQVVIAVEDIEAAIQESKNYYDQHLADTMQSVESAKTDMANAQQTLNETAQRLEAADLNYSEVTLKVDEIDEYIEGNIKSVKFDVVNAVVTEYESLVRQMEDEFGVNVEESFLSYLTGRVGKAEVDISVQSGKIESKVGYDEFQYMPVEDIDQYNKNLLFHTMDFSQSWERNDVRAYVSTDSFRHTRIIAMDISNAYYSSITDVLELGKTYTLSASFNIQPITKAPNEDKFAPTDGNYDVSAFINGTEYPMVNLVENLTGVNGFKRLSVSFVSENENPIVYFRIKNLNAETSTGYMTAPKLETGNESTPWQPHFDDEYATMLSTNSLVRQQGNEIVSLISSTKELGDKFVTATSSFQQLEEGFIRNAELITEYEDAVVRYGMEVEELNDRITQKVWMDDFSDAVETISIDGKNRVLNSDFVDMSTDNNQLVLGSWENVDPLFTIEKIDGINYAVIKREGLTGNLVASMASNRFAVKNGERLMFGFDIIVEAMPDVGNVFQIELLDINDIRVGLESFTLDQMDGDITLGEVSRLNYQYIINREDVSKARVRLMLTRNGHVKFTRVMAQQGTIKDTEWSPAPEDAQLIRMKMQTEINQTAEQIQILANDERLDAINDILYRKEGKLEVSPSEILARVTSAELGDDAVVTGTQLKLTEEGLRFDLVNKEGIIQTINASDDGLKIGFDRVEVNGLLLAQIISTQYLDVSEGFKIMNNGHMVLGISPDRELIINADRMLINSNHVLTTEDKDQINKKIDDSWIYQDPEGVIIGAISQELEKSKSDPLSTFSEMWSNITVNAEGIEAAVSKDGVIQSINLSNEEALIDFDKVRITGELLASLISAEKIDITDNFGIYYKDRLVFGVDAPTQTVHINSNNIMVNGKRVAIIDDVLTVDGKVIDLTGRVDGHDTQLSNIAQQVLAAIAEAEQAKKDAIKAHEDAVAEAEAKVQAKDTEYKLIFEDYDSTIETIEADSQTAKTTAEQALTDVGISTDLAQTAKELITDVKTNPTGTITGYNSLKNNVDSMVQAIGSDGGKIAQMVMTNSTFQTTVLNKMEFDTSNVYSTKSGVGPMINMLHLYRDESRAPNGIAFAGGVGGGGTFRIWDIITRNGWWTVSGWVRGSQSVNGSFRIDIADGPSSPRIQIGNDNTWKYFEFSHEVKNHSSIYHFVDFSDIANLYFFIKDLKIEQNHKATPYSLAPADVATQSQVTQLSNSWALTLKSGNDIKTQINASTNGIRLASNLIYLSGQSHIDNAVIKSAHIDSLNANKIVGNTADFNNIRAGVLTTDVVTSTHIKADTALFDTLFSTTSATSRLVAQGAWIEDANIKNINASKITAGTISASRISTGSLANVELGGTNLYLNSEREVVSNNRFMEIYTSNILSHLVGQQITFSFDIKVGSGGTSRPILVYRYQNSGISPSVSGIVTPTTNWVRYSFTGTVLSSPVPSGYSQGSIAFYDSVGYNNFMLRRIQIEKGNKETDWSPAPQDIVNDLKTSGRVVIHGGNIQANSIDVGKITGDTANFISAGFKALNSQATINGNAIRIQNIAGEFVEMNNTPELRSDDAGGTAVVLGKGRVQFYDSRGHAKGYIGTDMYTADNYDFGTYLSKGTGIYRFSRMVDATQTTYAYYTVKAGITSPSGIIDDMVRNGYLPDGNAQQFIAKGNMLSQLNGWPNYPNWPTLSAGQQIRYKELATQTAGNAYEDIWKFGPSSQGDWRIYFAKRAVFEGGYTGSSDRRLKHDIEPTQIEALGHIESLAFKEFKWNRDNKHEPLGLIAQDSGIIRVSDDDMEGLDIQRAIMLGLKGVQELQEIVKKQAEEIKQLKEIVNQ